MSERVKITKEMRQELLHHKKRTGMGEAALIKSMKEYNVFPDGLGVGACFYWSEGTAKTASKIHLNAVLEHWKKMPNEEESFTLITPELITKIKSQISRTGVSTEHILDGRNDVPQGVTIAQIGAWLYQPQRKRINIEQFDYVWNLWTSLPDNPKVQITDDIIEQLRAHQSKTGFGPAALLSGRRHETPEGLDSSKIQCWMRGTVKSAQKDHLDYVLNLWENFTPIEGSYVRSSPELHSVINEHIERTGIGAYTILRGQVPEKPKGINGRLVSNFLKNQGIRIRKDYLAYALKRWEETPDRVGGPKKKRYIAPKENYAEISTKDLERLQHFRDIGLTPTELIRKAKNVPDGVNAQTVVCWVNGTISNAQPHCVAFVLDEYEKLARHPQRPIIITDKMRKTLKAYRDQTGIGGITLLKNSQNFPGKLSGTMIAQWLNGQSKTARKDHWDYVMSAYEAVL